MVKIYYIYGQLDYYIYGWNFITYTVNDLINAHFQINASYLTNAPLLCYCLY